LHPSEMQPYPDVLLLTIFYFRRHILASILLVAGGDYTTKSITIDSHTYYYYFTHAHTHKIPTTELSRFSNTPHVTSSSPFYNSEYDSAAAFRNGTTTFQREISSVISCA